MDVSGYLVETKSPRYPLCKRLAGLQSRCVGGDERQESCSCGFGGSHSGAEDSGILECYTMSTDKWSPTFRNTIMLTSLRLIRLHSAVLGLPNLEYVGIFQIIQLNHLTCKLDGCFD
jgi:hypothetical protein